MFKKILKVLLPLVLLGMCSMPVMASNEAMQELLDILHKRESISTEEYKLLKKAVEADNKKHVAKKREIGEARKPLPKINTKGKLVFSDGEGNKVRIGGRMQYDTTFVGTDGNYGGSSESQLRSARIYLSGTWAKYWDFKFQYDLEDADDEGQSIEDAYIKWVGWPVHVTLGQRKAPYSMSNLTSSKYFAFIDRSFVSGLFNHDSLGVGNRNMGLTLTWDDQENSGFLLESGYYLRRTEQGRERDLDDANGFTGRLVWGDYNEDVRTLLHAGVSGGFRNFDNKGTGRVRVRPNVSEGDRVLDTGDILNADGYWSYNINIAGMYERFWAQAEYFYGKADLVSGASDDDMDGFIAKGGMFLTAGDSRRYSKGSWNSVKVKKPVGKGGLGAWEIAFRYDSAELGAGLIANSARKQSASAFTAALNWYLMNNIRLQANYVTTMCGRGECAWDRGSGESEPDFFILRAQTFF